MERCVVPSVALRLGVNNLTNKNKSLVVYQSGSVDGVLTMVIQQKMVPGGLKGRPATNKRHLLFASWLLIAVISYFVAFQPLLKLPELPTIVITISLALFGLVHGTYYLGAGRTAAFFLLTLAVSWLFEYIGLTTGVVGTYYYTDIMGPALGGVPIRILFAWFTMVYPAYIMATLIAGRGGNWGKIALTAALASMIITSWDLALDPSAIDAGAWIWVDGGQYFGIPYSNYAGWIVTTFIIYAIYGFFDHKAVRDDEGFASTSAPVAAYALMMARYIINPIPPEVALIVFFAMGTPVLAALIRAAEAKPVDESRPGSGMTAPGRPG